MEIDNAVRSWKDGACGPRYPEGEAPDNPTVEDVLAMIEIAGGLREVFEAWDIAGYMRLMVVKDDYTSGMEGDVDMYPEQYDEDPNMY